MSLPYRLRYQLAWDHDLCRAVVGVTMRAVLGWLRTRARLDGVTDGRGGAVAIVQRFGGALNLNVHLHALVMDGVFEKDAAGAVAFHPAPHLTDLDVAEVLATVAPRIRRVLDRRGLGDGDESSAEDEWAAEAPVLAGLAAASVHGRVRLQLRRRWADGTTHLEWDPVDFLGRLAVLVPRPRINLILYTIDFERSQLSRADSGDHEESPQPRAASRRAHRQ